MSKYHITRNGEPALCKATKNACPLGKHFNSEQEAYQNIQEQMSGEFGVIPTIEGQSLEKDYKSQMEIVLKGVFKSREHEELERTKLAELALTKTGKSSTNSSLIDVLNGIHKPDEGATFSLNNVEGVSMPSTGFCASPYPEHSKIFDSSDQVTAEELMSYSDKLIESDINILSEEDTYIGLWNDPETGKVYLDISKRYHTAKEAREACENNDQIAYFDLQVFESVDVDRNATSGQVG